MRTNEGPLDRLVRVIAAVVVAGIAFLVGPTSVIGIVLFVVAAVLLVTAAVGFCPLYRVFGISTCAVAKPEAKTGEPKVPAA